MQTVPKKMQTPRDPALVARRQDEILESAARFFSEHGYQNADMQSLANELNVGKGTLYRYFPSKEELFFEANERGMRLLQEYIDSKRDRSLSALEQVRAAIRTFFRFFDENHQYLELLIQERAEFKNRREPTYLKQCERGQKNWADLEQHLFETGMLRRKPNKTVDHTVNNMLYGTLFTSYFAGDTRFEDHTDRVVEVLLCGLLSPSAQEDFLATTSEDPGKPKC